MKHLKKILKDKIATLQLIILLIVGVLVLLKFVFHVNIPGAVIYGGGGAILFLSFFHIANSCRPKREEYLNEDIDDVIDQEDFDESYDDL